MRNILSPKPTESGVDILYPSYEEAYAVALSDLFPIENILIGVTHPFPAYKVKRRANGRSFLIEYVLEGEGEFRVQGKTVRVSGGEAFVICKDAPHDYRSNPDKPMKKLWISFVSDYLGKMLESYRIGTGSYRVDLKNEFISLYNVAKIDTSPQNKFFEIAEILQGIILKIARTAMETAEDALTSVKNALLASVYSRKTLDEIAAEAYTSRSNLIRIFKKQTGVTPYQFLLLEKINVAKTLLSTTTMQIKNIAELLSFTDEHYFSFLFKQKTGLTPSQYRNSLS
ncbi:MAG: AraC family transcriptional regulator [Clostridia bacterium]|nr:AraC family transcriptional regulator [Clostridia bacterium]